MRPHFGADDPRRIATFHPRGVALDGSTLDHPARTLLRRLRPAWILVSELAPEERFWDQVADLRRDRSAAHAWDLARSYGTGRRRMTIARLLLAAAGVPDGPEHATCVNAMCARGYNRGSGAERRGTYVFGKSFEAPLFSGAKLIARHGTQRCLFGTGASWCEADAAEAADYCRRHDREVTPRERRGVDSQMRRVFELVDEPIARGVGLERRVAEELQAVARSSARRPHPA